MALINGDGLVTGTELSDLITGGAGSDTILGNGANDTIDGGEGGNFAAYWSSMSSVAVQLGAGTATVDGHGGQDVLINIQGVIGSGFDDTISGSNVSDVLIGLGGNDTLEGLDGDDLIVGGAGNDAINGGGGSDKVFYSGNRADYVVTVITNGFTITDTRAGAAAVDADGIDTVVNVEFFQFANGTAAATDLISSVVSPNTSTDPTGTSRPGFSLFRDGTWSQETAVSYSGPVSNLQYQLLGNGSGEVAVGTVSNDFINLLGGDDAVNGGDGNDVLDGGTGSNFLTGGAGSDVFFLDGRSGQTTWSTVTDWQAGEQLSLWGWQPGVSHATWAESAGTAGYEGATMHCDLDGNGSIDASVTWSGMMPGALPTAIEIDGLLWIK
jgi:serralysin